jgi:hypothetical protein
MSRQTRNSSNLPDYYFNLNTKQKRRWRHHTRKIERAEELNLQYPPYNPSSNINVVHLHHQTKITTINELIQQAKTTQRYTIDTESQRHQRENHGALVQIEMIRSINYSTIILLEINHLPDVDSRLFERIKELWSIIFNSGNEIITWGPFAKEFENFQHLEWMTIGKIKKVNLQFLFQEYQDGTLTHPVTERRVAITGVPMDTPGDNNDYSDEEELLTTTSHKKQQIIWSLQSAVATALNKFLDKSETLNEWKCGLDLELETWRSRLFSKKQYDMQVEKQQRIKMINYAVHDCTSVTELYFTMYPERASRNISDENTTTLTITIETPKTSSTSMNNRQLDLSDVSDEEINIYIPQPEPEPNQLIIDATQEEMMDFSTYEQPQGTTTTSSKQRTTTTKSPEQTTTTTTAILSKQERQRRKNDKLKWKQRNRPDYQLKIRRPIYYKYDYHKIRSQLLDDDIHTSHQLTINRKKQEVLIGFKSIHEQQKAKLIMRINYFSREQFKRRWG